MSTRKPGGCDPEGPGAGGSPPPADAALMELEARHARLCAELAELEARLRALRLAADLCPQCGGTGRRWVRGGLYGEWQQQPCPCRPNPATDAPAGSPNPETGRR